MDNVVIICLRVLKLTFKMLYRVSDCSMLNPKLGNWHLLN